MVDVAQLVESRIVIPAVVGSSPIVHPIFLLLLFIWLEKKNNKRKINDRDDIRSSPSYEGPLAQLVEQETLNLLVESSNLSRPTTTRLFIYTSPVSRDEF